MIELRPYQVEAVERFNTLTKEEDNSPFLVNVATGGGKTVIGTKIAKDWIDNGGTVLWICHRQELKKQATAAALSAGIHKSRLSFWDAKEKVLSKQGMTVCMIMSTKTLLHALVSDLESKNYGVKPLVIIDESHHLAAETYTRLCNSIKSTWITETRFVLLTATPKDMDIAGIGHITEYKKDLNDLIKEGYLSPFEYHRVKTQFKYKAEIGRDFTQRSLNLLDTEERHSIIYDTWEANRQHFKKPIFFFATIKAAQNFLYHWHARSQGKVPGFLITGDDHPDIRASELQGFREFEEAILINVNVLTEGFDEPSIDAVFICRPTASRVLYAQMVGRGARLFPGKDKFYIIDFVDAIARHLSLSSDFANQILDEPKDPKISELDSEKTIRKFLRKHGMNVGTEKEPKPLSHSVVGICIFKDQFRKRPLKKALSDIEAKYIWALYQEIETKKANSKIDKLKDLCDYSYSHLGCYTTFTLKEWSSLFWAIFAHLKNTHYAPGNMSQNFQVHFLSSKLKPAKWELPNYETLCVASNRELFSSKLQLMDQADYADSMLKKILKLVYHYFSNDHRITSTEVKSVTRKGRVLTLNVSLNSNLYKYNKNKQFADIRWFNDVYRMAAREVLQDDYIATRCKFVS